MSRAGKLARTQPPGIGVRQRNPVPEGAAGRSLVTTTWACFTAVKRESLMAQLISATCQPPCSCALPCEDLLYIQLQGRAPRAGPGLAAIHAKAPRDGGADC